MPRKRSTTDEVKVGYRVLIRSSSGSPYAGQTGIITEINRDDCYGAILVRFSDGLQFRYARSELELLVPSPSDSPHSSGKWIGSIGTLVIDGVEKPSPIDCDMDVPGRIHP